MKFKSLLITVLILLFATQAMAVNSVAYSHPVISITTIDSDWDDTEARRVQFIICVPGAVDDELVMRQGSTTGPLICGKMLSTDGEARICPVSGSKVDMFLDYSDSTISSGGSVTILMWEN